MNTRILLIILISASFIVSGCGAFDQSARRNARAHLHGTASLMIIVERESGSVIIVDSVNHEVLGRVEGLGNLRHESMVFSRDARYAYVIGRSGNLSKVDLVKLTLEKKVIVGENSIGIAISRDNKYIMVCNYRPGNVVILDSATLETVKVIPATTSTPDGEVFASRTVGPLDTPDNLMVFALMDTGEVWIVDMKQPDFPVIKKFTDIGDTPYDQLITPDGRFYLVGFVKSDWVGILDLWKLDEIKKIDMSERREGLKKYSGGKKVPVYHIPHLESWAVSGNLTLIPAFAEKRVVVYDTRDWSMVKSIPIAGTGLFVVARPGGREVWVDNVEAPGSEAERLVQIIDVETLEVKKTIDVGKGAIDPQFTPRGEAVYISVMGEDRVAVYDTDTYELIKNIPAKKPSGLFGTDRASKFGL
ncbi:MAG: cytochrome D1 domain-containing protein [Thermodesulfobacteriota bacterium]